MNAAQLRQVCATALRSSNMKAFLRVIRAGETSQEDKAFTTLVGNTQFSSLADHPRKTVWIRSLQLYSTAAGAYQFLARTWDECAKALELPDFSPASQDLAAVFLIRRRKALEAVLAGNVERAIALCAREWASLPGSPYGQPVKKLDECLRIYATYGGTLQADQAAAPQPTKGPDMPILAPFLKAALPSLVQSIPLLGQLFGSGSEVSDRNIKTAELAVKILQDSTGARNVQEAVEILKTDPAAVATATEAVQAHWLELTEAGGGGIDGARKADTARMTHEGPWWEVLLRSHSFWVAMLMLPLVYLIVFSIIGVVGNAEWSPEVRASIAGLIVGTIIGGLMGYYFGQTTSRNRTPAAPAP